MEKQISGKTDYAINALKTSFLFSIVAASYAVARSSLLVSKPQIGAAVAFDLTLSLPFFYLVFIRRTKISRLTVAPVFVFGVILASLILPVQNQHFLNQIKFFALPAVELSILSYAGYLFYKMRRTYKTIGANGADFIERLRESLTAELSIAGAAVTFEIAGFYYAFVRWRSDGRNGFTCYKENGVLAVLAVLAFIVSVETFVVHFLLVKLNFTLAWVVTGLSVYFLFQIFAHGKAVWLRLIEVTKDKIYLRCGLIGDAAIDVKMIEGVEFAEQNAKQGKGIVKLSPIGKLNAPNLKLTLREAAILHGIYGKQTKFKTIYLTVDNHAKLKQQIENAVARTIEI